MSSEEGDKTILDHLAGVEEERERSDAGGENERMRQRVSGNEVAEETRENACELLGEIGRG